MQKSLFAFIPFTLFLTFSSSLWAAEDQAVLRSGSQGVFDGSSKVFTGQSKIEMLYKATPDMPHSGAYVTFNAGARSFWHTHPVGQILIVVDGEGRTGVWGEKVDTIKKGDTVVCPKGVKHFHGAAPDQHMVQMTITGELPDGKNVDWLEAVTDDQYNNLAN